MWIARLILINIFSSSVLGEIHVVVQYSADYNNRPTVSLTAVQSNITIKGKRCIDRNNPCTQDSHVTVNSGEKTECYSNTYNQNCGWGFTIEVTDTYDTIHTNLTVTRDYNPGLQLDLRVSCSGDRNVTLRNNPQTYQPVDLRWTAPSLVNINKVSKFMQLKDGQIINETDWNTSIWSAIIGCSDRFGTSTQTTENETSAQTTSSVVVSTTMSDVLYTKTSVVTKNAETPRAQEDETSAQTTNSVVVSTTTSDALYNETSVVTKNSETPGAQDSSQLTAALEKYRSAELTIYILGSFVGLLVVIVIVCAIFIIRLKRNQKSNHSSQTKSAAELGQPTVVIQEEPVGAYESLKMDNYENEGTYEQIQNQQNSCYEEILPAE